MAKRNILIKKKNEKEWDELYPITTASNVKLANGSDVESQMADKVNFSGANNSVVQSISPNTWTDLDINKITTNNGHYEYDSSDKSIKIKKSGFYLVLTQCSLYQLPKGKMISSKFTINNLEYVHSKTNISHGQTYEASTWEAIAYFNIGDKLKLKILHDADNTMLSDADFINLLFLRY